MAKTETDKITAIVIDLPPCGYETDGHIRGFYSEFAKDIADLYTKDKRWLKLDMVVAPYSRAQQLITQIPNSFTIMSNTAQIKKQALSAGVLLNLDVIALSKPDTKLNSIDDLAHLSILKIRGTTLVPEVSGRIWLETSNPMNQLTMLYKNRADVIVGVPQDYAFARAALSCSQTHRHLCHLAEMGGKLNIRQTDVHVWTGKNNEMQFVADLYETVFHYKLTEQYRELSARVDNFK